MLRTIEFKGYHFGDRYSYDGWVYGYLIKANELYMIRTEDSKKTFVVDKDSVGQYIGINDVLGRKVYEGDFVILKRDYPKNDLSEDVLGIIRFDKCRLSYVLVVIKNGSEKDIYNLKSDSKLKLVGDKGFINPFNKNEGKSGVSNDLKKDDNEPKIDYII